jgi:hypothetical protein
MDYRQVLSYLKEARKPANQRGKGQERLFDRFSLVDFLLHSIKKDVPVFIDARGISVCSVLMPAGRLKGSYAADLLKWDIEKCQGGGYSVCFSGGVPMTMAVAPPLEMTTDLMSYGEHIAHERVLRLGASESRYIELSQDFALMHDLHNVAGRGVYCKVNQKGSVEDVAHVLSKKEMRLLTVSRDVLCSHMYETGTVLVRLLDLQVAEDMVEDLPDGRTDLIVEPPGQGLCLRVTCLPGEKIWVRGFQLMRTPACPANTENDRIPTVHAKEEG